MKALTTNGPGPMSEVTHPASRPRPFGPRGPAFFSFPFMRQGKFDETPAQSICFATKPHPALAAKDSRTLGVGFGRRPFLSEEHWVFCNPGNRRG
jgi:hypothetical protein